MTWLPGLPKVNNDDSQLLRTIQGNMHGRERKAPSELFADLLSHLKLYVLCLDVGNCVQWNIADREDCWCDMGRTLLLG